MKKYLLPNEGQFFKANLHCHTNYSDAHLTPEEVKQAYKEKGYSIVAYTDHDVLFNHYKNLLDENFLPLVGYELSVDGPGSPYQYQKMLHMNVYAKDPSTVTQPFFNNNCVPWLKGLGNELSPEHVEALNKSAIVDEGEGQLFPAKVNAIIDAANKNGFFVTLNHPNWSLLTCSDCIKYEGLWAVEIYNHGCFAISGLPDDDRVYDEFLRSGKKIFVTATDDNHNSMSFDDPTCDSFGGWTMIKAESLDYASIIDAMEKGNFYASQGPEIKELYFEDGKIHIECSEAREICLNSLTRACIRVGSNNCDLTSADFEISDSLHGYVRFKVIDKHGKAAWTNPYYVKDLMEVKDHRAAII